MLFTKISLALCSVIFFSVGIFAGQKPANEQTAPVEKILIAKYFPLDESQILLYNSNFGPTKYSITKTGEEYIQEYESDKFFSAQNIKLIDNSMFILSMEQEVEVLLFISHGISVTYNEPALLLPLFLELKEEWMWKGVEYIDEKIDTVTITGSLVGFEEISCKAGNFNCLRFDYVISKSSGKVTKFTEWREKDIGIVKLTADVSQKGFAGMMINLLGYDDIYFVLEKIEVL